MTRGEQGELKAIEAVIQAVVAEERDRCIKAVCDNCRNIPPHLEGATPVFLRGRWVHRLIGRDYDCGASAIRISSESR